MNESIHLKLYKLANACHLLGKYDESNALLSIGQWLLLNDVETLEDLGELLECSHDNPSIIALENYSSDVKEHTQ